MQSHKRNVILAACAVVGVGLSLFAIPGAQADGTGGYGGQTTTSGNTTSGNTTSGNTTSGTTGGGVVDECAECVFDFIKCEEKAQQGPSNGMPNMQKKLQAIQKCIDELKDCEFDNLTGN